MKDLTYLEKYRDTQTERDYYHRRGDSDNGAFKVYINGRSSVSPVTAEDGSTSACPPATANGRHRPPGLKCARSSACFSRMKRPSYNFTRPEASM